jgi:hypothetical protein
MTKEHFTNPRSRRLRENGEAVLAREEKLRGRRLRKMRGDGEGSEIPADMVPSVSGQRREEARLSRLWTAAQEAFGAMRAKQAAAGRERQREMALKGMAPRRIRRAALYINRPIDSRKRRKARQAVKLYNEGVR